ncbi:hypothetical protein DE146DRAFT_762333 [Phaeosphaeria sp. MPI-PUGE-AT-0046c]|nr:hypothetical protein DE146DRAFT_762333 [Phaeosphaeria sp. MPI-PUGE-AT-0046c]
MIDHARRLLSAHSRDTYPHYSKYFFVEGAARSMFLSTAVKPSETRKTLNVLSRKSMAKNHNRSTSADCNQYSPLCTRNRIDVDPSLVNYHESGTGPMPSPAPTKFLPCRTRLAADPFTEITKAQSEAYYEEITTVPAASLDLKSEFSAGHWHVVHPVTYCQVRDYSIRVMKNLKEWLEVKCPNDLFTRKAKQVFAFKKASEESLEEVKKELAGRAKRGEGVDVAEKLRENEPVSRHTKGALEEAAEAGRKAAEEAKILDEWQMEH